MSRIRSVSVPAHGTFGTTPDVEHLRAAANATLIPGEGKPLRYPAPPAGHLVYFVGGLEGPVKIGWTQQPIKERLKCIQSGSPIKLHVLALLPAVRQKEAWYHRRFAAHRLHGEWFERHPDIVFEIEMLAARYVPFAFEGVVQSGTAEPLGFLHPYARQLSQEMFA